MSHFCRANRGTRPTFAKYVQSTRRLGAILLHGLLEPLHEDKGRGTIVLPIPRLGFLLQSIAPVESLRILTFCCCRHCPHYVVVLVVCLLSTFRGEQARWC